MAQPIIQFFNVTKIFGKNVVLDNLNLDIPFGEIFGIIGKSGSGKTTLLSILVGFIKAEKGKIFFQGQDITKMPDSVKQQIGFTSQEGSFYPKLSVRENLEYFGTLYNLSSVELKDKMAGFWSVFSEIELKFDDINEITVFCFEYMPSSIEILEPEELKFESTNFAGFLNDLLARLHEYDMVVKNLQAENMIMKKKQENK